MNKFVKLLTFILIFLTMSINVSAMEVGEDSLKNSSRDIPQIGSEVEDLPTANYIRLFGDINKVEDVCVENSKIVFKTKDDGYVGLNECDFKLTDYSKFFVVFKYAKDNSYASIQEINYIDFDSLIESKENLGDENYFPRVYIESNKGFFKENLTCSYIVYFLEDNSYIEKKLNNYASFVGKEVDKSCLDTFFVDKVGSFGDIELN